MFGLGLGLGFGFGSVAEPILSRTCGNENHVYSFTPRARVTEFLGNFLQAKKDSSDEVARRFPVSQVKRIRHDVLVLSGLSGREPTKAALARFVRCKQRAP